MEKIRRYKKVVNGVQFHLKDAIETAKEHEGFLKIDDDGKVKLRCTIKYFCIDIDVDVGFTPFGREGIVASLCGAKYGRTILKDKDWLLMDASGVVRSMSDEEFKEEYELIK